MSFTSLSNPLLQHYLGMLRDQETSCTDFRALLNKVTAGLLFEISKHLPSEKKEVHTPLEIDKNAERIQEENILLVSILRAGNGMLEPALQFLPNAVAGHIGLYRDSNHESVQYYLHLPKNLSNFVVLVLDPMLATGGSACHALRVLKEKGAKKILFLSLLAAPEGVKRLETEHPDVPGFALQVDRQLNDKAYILPGLGDAGDRIYNTFD